jgi:methylated-DNA-[protein]-cysteine S-methyltransferase
MKLSMMITGSPLGPVRLYARSDELAAVHLADDATDSTIEAELRTTPVLEVAAAQLAEYFAGKRRTFDLPLGPRGTAFQQHVWSALVAIPFGETRSYGAIAASIGKPAASRAVGAANGKNPIWIIVPCHRVIGASGELTGYAGGIAVKRWLLDHERKHRLVDVGPGRQVHGAASC